MKQKSAGEIYSFFVCDMDENFSYVIQNAEKSSTTLTYCLSILLQNGVSLKITSGYIAL